MHPAHELAVSGGSPHRRARGRLGDVSGRAGDRPRHRARLPAAAPTFVPGSFPSASPGWRKTCMARVLIVDDDPAIRTHLATYVRDVGHDAEVAADATAA